MPTTLTPVYIETDRNSGPFWRVTVRSTISGAQVVRFSSTRDEVTACRIAQANACHALRCSAAVCYVVAVEPVTVLRRLETMRTDDITFERAIPLSEMTAEELAIVDADERASHPVLRLLPHSAPGLFQVDGKSYSVTVEGEVRQQHIRTSSAAGVWRKVPYESKAWFDVNLAYAASLATVTVEPNYDEEASAEYNAMTFECDPTSTALVQAATVEDPAETNPDMLDHPRPIAGISLAAQQIASDNLRYLASTLETRTMRDIVRKAAATRRYTVVAEVRKEHSAMPFVVTSFNISFYAWPTWGDCLTEIRLSGYEMHHLVSITLIKD